MAIDETDMPEGAVGDQAEHADTDDTANLRADDFRLRLDSPLFHRDPGMAAAAQAPQLRELTWEHVVRPSSQQTFARQHDGDDSLDSGAVAVSAVELLPGLKPVQLSPVPSIEALLEQSRTSREHPVVPAEPAEDAIVGTTSDVDDTSDDTSDDTPDGVHDGAHDPSPAAEHSSHSSSDHSGSMPRSLPTLSSFSSALAAERELSDVPSGEVPAVDTSFDAVSSNGRAGHGYVVKDPSGPLSFGAGVEQYRSDDETDDEAADWAALNVIAENKPETTRYAQPRIDSLLAALEQMDGAEAEHDDAPVEEPSVESAHEMRDLERPETDQRHDEMMGHLERFDFDDPGPEVAEQPFAGERMPTNGIISGAHPIQRPISGSQRAITGSQPVTPQSAVEAELNRLAFLPDQEETVGPVEVPAIAYSAQPMAPAAGAPALSQHEMYSPRQAAPVVHSRTSFLDLAANAYAPPPRKKKRHFLRNMVSLLLLLAIIGGGLLAAKYYLLDKRWDGHVKELASEVEKSRHLSFDHAITVTALPVDEYATKIATLSLGLSAENTAAVSAEWRSLGLLTGPLDLRAIGLNAMPDSPAYYDPASETIYTVVGLPTELYDFAMRRALTLTLLDQTYGWGDRVKGASASVANGTRALYDADALATANALTPETTRQAVFEQILDMYPRHQIPSSPAPYGSTVTGRLGVALMPYVQSIPVDNRPTVLKDRTITDGQALDVRRLVAGTGENVPAGSRGMLYWFHVLAARVDTDTAWTAALAWRGDDLALTVNPAGLTCVVANITVDPATLDGVTRAFQQWAAGAPAESASSVTSAQLATGGQVTISACDPTDAVLTNDGRPRISLGGAPLRAEQFRLLLLAAQPPLPAAQAACAVFGSDDITINDDRGVIDAAAGWQAPVNHPAPDPNRLGCAPAA